MILVDSNIPMYLIGPTHPRKADAQRAVETLIANGQRLVSDAEVLQEILHRYSSIKRHANIQPAFDVLLGMVDEVFPVSLETAERAKRIVLGYSTISARDALHLAVMQEHGIDHILSFDSGFDGFSGITRIF